MKVLKTNDFVSERIQLQPITNAELAVAQKEIMAGPGRDLKEYDILVVACECLADNSVEINCGTFLNSSRKDNYPEGYIHYWNSTLGYDVLKEKYEWTYNNAYTHYVLEVYRPYPGKEKSLHESAQHNVILKVLENSRNYYCVYENPTLLRKFGVK